jgi:hypothetical protein
LTGTITSSGCSTGTCKFVITTRDTTSGHYRRLTISDHQPYPAVQSAVLEVYGVDQCGDLPDTRDSVFSGVSVTGAGTPSWTPRVFAADPACGYRVSFSGNNATLAY